MYPTPPDAYRSWLIGELVLVGALGVGTVLLAVMGRLEGWEQAEARVALDTAVAVFALIVSTLATIRFLVGARARDMLLAGGFLAAGLGTFAFGVTPLISGRVGGAIVGWAGIGAQLVAAALIAAAPFAQRQVSRRRRALAACGLVTVVALAGLWLDAWALDLDVAVTGSESGRPAVVILAFAILTLFSLVAAVGFGLRFRRHRRDLDSWLTLALTLIVVADLHYVLTPVLSPTYVLPGDFLRLLAYGVLLVGVWHAISQAEFGRAVAEERARVAQEIHDGLAQYLFALSTHVSMLEAGAPIEEALPRLKQAAAAAQQEARFAVLALSSASGTAPFHAALRRYVDVLTADGELEVEVDVDAGVRLAPDEQIEIFRIVQEGLANARRHAGTCQAEVFIGQRSGRRVVIVRDDGEGFEGGGAGGGQGLKNMRSRAASIEGAFSLRSSPGRGTAIEVVLRPVPS